MTGEFAAEAGGGDDNLVLRAARRLAEVAGGRRGAALTLDKRIPVAAGLGGGSADAAATLRLLNRLWELDHSDGLGVIAAGLGSDVPACLVSRTRLGRGRGERLEPVDLATAGWPALLVNPRVAVPTAAVFAAWDGLDRGALRPEAWLAARNDLEPPARAVAPVIGDVLAALAATAPRVSRLSGSGATCFALYEEAEQAAAAAATLRAAKPGWWIAITRLH